MKMDGSDELCEVSQTLRDHVPRQLLVGNLTVEGFSRAAVQTYWRVPELKLGFDVGAQPWAFMGLPRLCISHTHMDHILSLPAYVARRRMMKMTPPVIYIPIESVGGVKNLLTSYSRLDYGGLPCELIGVCAGDEFMISRELMISVVPTFHSIPSVGYIVWERRKKLKEEYSSLSGNQIRDLALSGVEVSREFKIPKVAYLGDSTAKALDETPGMYEAEILIMEMSFVAKRHQSDKIHKYGHIHLDDIVKRQKNFKNKAVILSHFSARYADKEIEMTVARRLPNMLDGKLVLWF
ncbi:MAG: metal-dependent hydrolase [Planctomycetaceae bacterium]|jgi:ribonuclease Z|nr:metal-dependent hydrolase [Planctomycetaceae bacterium]